jgi:hypothetical protein
LIKVKEKIMGACVQCGFPLEAHDGRGRPPRYCSHACRRLAEYELKRLAIRIGKLDDELIEMERRAAGLDYGGNLQSAQRRLEFAQGQRREMLAKFEALVRHTEGVDEA